MTFTYPLIFSPFIKVTSQSRKQTELVSVRGSVSRSACLQTKSSHNLPFEKTLQAKVLFYFTCNIPICGGLNENGSDARMLGPELMALFGRFRRCALTGVRFEVLKVSPFPVHTLSASCPCHHACLLPSFSAMMLMDSNPLAA